MGWSAKTDKTRNSRFYDSRIVGYKKITKQKFKVLKIYWLIKILQNEFFSTLQFSNHKISNFSFCRFELATPFIYTTKTDKIKRACPS